MIRSKLKKKYLKNRTVSDKKTYNKQRNKCAKSIKAN